MLIIVHILPLFIPKTATCDPEILYPLTFCGIITKLCMGIISLPSLITGYVAAYSVVDNIVNLSDHLPVLCDIRVAKFRCSNATCGGNKSKHVNCVRRWDKTDLGLFCGKSGEYLQCIDVPYDLLYYKCDIVNCSHESHINDCYELHTYLVT